MIGRLTRCERGNSFIEMGFAAPLLAALLIGMVDVSRGVAVKLRTVQAAQRTVELVQRTGFAYDKIGALETEAETAAGEGSNATVTAWMECGTSTTRLPFTTTTCAEGEPYSKHMDVTVTQTFTPLFGTGLFPGANDDGTFTVTALAGMRVQ